MDRSSTSPPLSRERSSGEPRRADWIDPAAISSATLRELIAAHRAGVVAAVGEPVTPVARPRARRWTILAVTLLVLALVPLAALSEHAYRLRNSNLVAMADVIAAGRALQQLDGSTVVDMTITGPGVVPALLGTEVSAGTTLFVRRWRNGAVYVRGSHENGDAIYYYRGDGFYVAPKPEAAATGAPHA